MGTWCLRNTLVLGILLRWAQLPDAGWLGLLVDDRIHRSFQHSHLIGQQLELWTLISMGMRVWQQIRQSELFQEREELLLPGYTKWFRGPGWNSQPQHWWMFDSKRGATEACQLKVGKDAKGLGGLSGLRHISTWTSTPGGKVKNVIPSSQGDMSAHLILTCSSCRLTK